MRDPFSLLTEINSFHNFPDERIHTDFLVAFRRHLHQNPELGFEEFQTAETIEKALTHLGLAAQKQANGTGLWVDIDGKAGSRQVGYRADIDALPIPDAKMVSYASKVQGKAHLCGHDVHTTIALGVAYRLAQSRDTFSGMVRVFFQPNEEGTPSGAPLMIRDGVLDGLQAVFAIHVDPNLSVGTFGLKEGASTAGCDVFQVGIKGEKTGHSARPHESGDPVWITTQVLNSLYQLVGRITDSRNPAILTVCQLGAGDAANVIPDRVQFGGTLRVADLNDHIKLRHQFVQTIEHFCSLYNAIPEIDFRKGAPAVMNDSTLNKLMHEVVARTFGSSAIFDIPRTSMGAEDFAHYGAHLPIYLVRIGTSSGAATAYPLHDTRFDVDEAAIPKAIILMSEALKTYLNQDD